MKTKPVIAIDIDDVLASSAEGFIAWSNKMFGLNHTALDYQEHWALIWQVDQAEADRRAVAFHESDAVASYEVLPTAREVLEKLKERFTLILLTSRRSTFKKLTKDWIDKYYPDIFTDTVFCGFFDISHTGGLHKTKASLAEELKADYLIDDQLKHVEAVAEVGIKGLLFGDYSWNKKDSLPPNVTRVKNWKEVADYFAR